jgi:hypothetical protein
MPTRLLFNEIPVVGMKFREIREEKLIGRIFLGGALFFLIVYYLGVIFYVFSVIYKYYTKEDDVISEEDLLAITSKPIRPGHIDKTAILRQFKPKTD